MEQRIGSSSQPLEGAGFDPAFVPGITSPVSKETEAEETGEVSAEEVSGEEVSVDKTSLDKTSLDKASAEKAEEAGKAEETVVEDDDDADPDGPVFEAADRRARIVADHRGVRLALDDQECEFRWDEIGAVETETARFGKRFTITVHTPDRRWYPIEIEATARSRFSEWESQLDAVLDAYFEESD
ncbi:hypothetical protein AB0I00_29260 [Streptomyces sp. NPDC050803]|uniref:hypothetical protein n=1 Tax=unclassified Streptomyces TaxID=2593676 RepID=UPI003438FD5B